MQPQTGGSDVSGFSIGDIQSWLTGGVGLGAAVGAYFAGNRKGKAEFINAVTKASEMVINQLQEECSRVRQTREDCEKGHAQCREEMITLKQEIWDLVHNAAVAEYKPSDLRRVGDLAE